MFKITYEKVSIVLIRLLVCVKVCLSPSLRVVLERFVCLYMDSLLFNIRLSIGTVCPSLLSCERLCDCCHYEDLVHDIITKLSVVPKDLEALSLPVFMTRELTLDKKINLNDESGSDLVRSGGVHRRRLIQFRVC